MSMLTEIEVKTTAISALQRIARKPGWPETHKWRREFYVKREEQQHANDIVRAVDQRGCPWTDEERGPLYLPLWAEHELNACDCPKCIAIQALADMREAVGR